MSKVNDIYNYAELSFAAYADLSEGDTLNQKGKLTNADFTSKQAEKFAARYSEVITQFNDTETSFSATVFKEAVTGNLTLAFKGTLEFGDFIPTDGDIALHGAAYDQIVAMYNWWQRMMRWQRASSWAL